MGSRGSPLPDVPVQEGTKRLSQGQTKRRFRRNRVNAAAPHEDTTSAIEDGNEGEYRSRKNEKHARGRKARRSSRTNTNSSCRHTRSRSLSPSTLGVATVSNHAHFRGYSPASSTPTYSSSKTSINLMHKIGSTSTSLAPRYTSTTTVYSTNTESTGSEEEGDLRNRTVHGSGYWNDKACKIDSPEPLVGASRNAPAWWKAYRSTMVRPFDECLLVCEAPSKKTSAIIHYLCSMYAEFKTVGSNMGLHRVQLLNLPYVAECLEKGDGIDDQDDFGQTPLMEAARSWHVDVSRYFLDNDADLRRHDNFGRAPIHIAAAADRPDVLALLLDRGASVNASTALTEETPLHLAARKGAMSALSFLLRAGGDVESRDYRQRTPLYIAAAFHRMEVVSFLLQCGAQTNIIDSTGISLYIHLVQNCPTLVSRALDTLVLRDNITQTSTADVGVLESSPEEWLKGVGTNLLLDLIEGSSCRGAIRHPVIRKMLETRWQMFARTWDVVNIVFRLMFFLLWTAWIWSVSWENKHKYTWPSDWWRALLPLQASLSLIWEVKIEIQELRYTIVRGVTLARLCISGLKTDMQNLAHPRWQDEINHITRKLKEAKQLTKSWCHLITYLRSLWNLYDIICFCLVLICVFTHVADVANHTVSVARLHVELGAVVTLLLGARLMKDTRGFLATGQLVIMLGFMAADIGRFICLYLQIYIPFTIAFWIIFGGQRLPQDQSNCAPNCTFISVEGMETYPELCFSLFRLTLVDEYDIGTMREINPIMTSVLIGGFLFTSAVIGINFLIGLFSNALGEGARQHVYTNSLLQRLNVVLLIEQTPYWFGPRPDKCREELISKAQHVRLDLTEASDMELTTQESIHNINEEITILKKMMSTNHRGQITPLSDKSDHAGDNSEKPFTGLTENCDSQQHVSSEHDKIKAKQGRQTTMAPTRKVGTNECGKTGEARRIKYVRQDLRNRIIVSD